MIDVKIKLSGGRRLDVLCSTRKDSDTLRLNPIERIVGCPLFRAKGRQRSLLLLEVVGARACDADLKSNTREHLFSPIDAEVGDWTADADSYNWGWGEIYVTARDMAKFGL